ncbi:TPA: hypothetical protein RPW15_001862 [Campylobacter fetus subsp. venerealis]|uniref:Uncharacterized protein n=1 Tax=Campylobacter fetus subsp. venerealis NCTC 10354 TaxID=983328 RepID=A0AAE6IYV2_CAMFE|nr:hypothetical protein [Campylobacter fetus]OCS25329.1 hypothetical protein CFVB10_09005 [Campylobacter fetus subsp. venerealis cfvB10]OCS29074.1 hypothetical protein CFVCCUG33900_08205 [Campylobacter fetus subsp. venerealis LMG 6570 = CCUG 33900]AIR80156.1 hypothetical protein CFV97608_0493 [Campylobacter fetus subsp. venerealis 97/608]EAK0836199.1 hypothetical protein [Campylobacter fetus]EGU23636.1 Hypothetical protein CFV354_0549 [Campylobacter fetus subsp. venerealis NCTC 10354]
MEFSFGNIKPKLDRYKLGMGLAKAGFNESLHRYIESVICDDEKLTIILSHNLAKLEFDHSKEQFLSKARVYYKDHARDFEALNFIPKRIEAKVVFKSNDKFKNDPLGAPTPINPPKKVSTAQFENRAKDPLINAGFENIRKVIYDRETNAFKKTTIK